MTNEAPDSEQRPIGELFTRLYLQSATALQDSPAFRTRLEAYFDTKHDADQQGIGPYLKIEGGIAVTQNHGYNGTYYDFEEFFTDAPIASLLDAITLIWRYLHLYARTTTVGSAGSRVDTKKADAWLAFVRRVLHEENLAYTVDDQGGVHFFVDQEFERNRVSALRCLDATRYAGIRTAFEAAHSYLDAHPADTKASVRSAFEALEILARLIAPESRNLNKFMVENKLMPLAQALAQDHIEKLAIERVFQGIGLMVDGLHNYRHGQGTEQPIAPSLPMAVYVLSSVAATLRWLVLIDSIANRRQTE